MTREGQLTSPRDSTRRVIRLSDAVQYLPGVGPRRAVLFQRLRIATVGDLLWHLPFRYDVRPRSQPIGSLRIGEQATVIAAVESVRTSPTSRGTLVRATLSDGTGRCSLRWFNSDYLLDRLARGVHVRASGRVEDLQSFAGMTNPRTDVLPHGEDPLADDHERVSAVYAAVADLPSSMIASLLRSILEQIPEPLPEFLPDALRRANRQPSRNAAIHSVHQPASVDAAETGRRRLAYDELLFHQLTVLDVRARRDSAEGAPTIHVSREVDARIRRRLPFALTAGQDRAIREIVRDLARPRPMNRMLQADVGAGKTAVAVYAALAAIACGCQVALLAPTEVLVQQHMEKISGYLRDSRVRIARLSGSTAAPRRRRLLDALGSGEVDWLVGTHALLEKDVRFRNLGMVIIDEQQRFGVGQRSVLAAKGSQPHLLVLSATPIPRSLAMALLGDLDTSTIDGVVPGRQPVVTRLVTQARETQAWEFVRRRLAAGEQAYIVYPLVEQSEAMPLRAAAAEVELLSRGPLRGFTVGLLHGRMAARDKNAAMADFHARRLHAIVATTVIEVGVDVPNATLMIIRHADRYGLSQLHQLRGRVGRGDRKSYCLLFLDRADRSSPGDDIGDGSEQGPAGERLRILCETNDGFRIAEEDLRIRGPGDLLGKRQHGLPAFRAVDFARDTDLIATTRADATALLARDPRLSRPEHAALRRALREFHGDGIKLFATA